MSGWDPGRSSASQPGFRETCVKCSQDLHVCLNCALYDEFKPWKCRSQGTDTVVDKGRFNYCEEFQFADKTLPAVRETRKPDETRRKWEGLFKKEDLK